MNYPESSRILDEVKKAKKILLNCHRSPDPDSLCSAFSMKQVLENMGKEVYIICPSLPSRIYNFIGDLNSIEMFENKLDFDKYDLLIVLDTERWEHYGVSKRPNRTVVNIDHHPGNDIAGDVEILDTNKSSTTNILYEVFRDWDIDIDDQLAFNLAAGIYADTGFFQFSSTTPSGLRAAADLMEKGADIDDLVFKLVRQNNFNLLKLWGEYLQNMQIDKESRFVWAAVPYTTFKKYRVDVSTTSLVSSLFLRTVVGTDFALAICEKENKKLNISLRSRVNNFDVSVIARELNGGGHKNASGASVEGLPFDKAVEKVLEVARKHAQKNQDRGK